VRIAFLGDLSTQYGGRFGANRTRRDVRMIMLEATMPHSKRDPERLLHVLEGLLAIPAADLETALIDVCNQVAKALDADKVDAFLYHPEKDTLVAIGSSTQPLSALQKSSGLDVLPRSNGGRVVWVFNEGKTFLTGHLEADPEELRGVKTVLKIKSKIGVPITVADRRCGMMMIASLQPEFFTEDDARFAETIVRWVGMVVHRAELVQELSRAAVEQGRRAVAEELVTVLAHDLRGLLAPVAMRLELIRRRNGADASRHREDAEAALRSLGRIKRVIGDLLDVARIDQGLFRVDLGPVNLAGVAEEVASTLRTPAHQIQVEASDEVIVLADPERLRQCLENVLGNAIQHSPHEAPVHVVVGKENQSGGPFGHLKIKDEGPGIPPEILPRIFERFAAGARSSGLGLGLYLAKRIAAAHGGDLIAESPPGRGACFTLTVPLYAEDRYEQSGTAGSRRR
jgi:two-component system OmpR family sensor kinase